jgi:arylsulfatase A-like enzyme
MNNTSLGKKIPKNLVTLPEILKKNNYTTLGISSIPYFSSVYGFDRGFDTFDDSWGYNSFDNVKGELKMVYDFLPNVTDEAIGFIRNNSNKKFFLIVHYDSPHAPYNTTPLEYIQNIPSNANITHLLNIAGQEGQLDNETAVNNLSPEEIAFVRSAYDGKIRYADSEINKILNEVKNQHLEGKTIIVVMSDHGESLGEYSYFGHGRETPNEETAHVPLILKIPNMEPQTVTRYVQTMDLAPTLLDATGIEKPGYYQGRNLFSNNDEIAYQEYINYVIARKPNQEVVYNKETGEMNSSWDGGIRDFNANNEALVKKLNITYEDATVPQYIINILKKRGLIR